MAFKVKDKCPNGWQARQIRRIVTSEVGMGIIIRGQSVSMDDKRQRVDQRGAGKFRLNYCLEGSA